MDDLVKTLFEPESSYLIVIYNFRVGQDVLFSSALFGMFLSHKQAAVHGAKYP